jgi:hypothetical protein
MADLSKTNLLLPSIAEGEGVEGQRDDQIFCFRPTRMSVYVRHLANRFRNTKLTEADTCK